MSNIAKWNVPSAVVTALSTELDALANNTMSAASGVIANQTNLDVYVDIELVLAALSPVTGAYVAVYLAEAIDGTNYPTPSAADQRQQTDALLCTFVLSLTAATAQRLVKRQVMIPPGTFKLYVDNQSGVAFGATLNTLKLLPYNVNLNG
jgi:hypothetical protein